LVRASPQEEAEQASAQRHELYNDWRRLVSDRQELLIAYIQGKVAKVLGLSTLSRTYSSLTTWDSTP